MTKGKILVVDDEPFIRRSLEFVLKKQGYEVHTATNGEEALEFLNRANGGKPDLMFLDVMMPKVNGFQVVETVKNTPDLSNIYVILLTAKGQEADRQKGFELGADDFMIKPFSPSRLLEKVATILSEEG
ncbi:MAG: response regulator [Calditrichaeota bacterium]|nr:response regulator [Calditrichota bacterium]